MQQDASRSASSVLKPASILFATLALVLTACGSSGQQEPVSGIGLRITKIETTSMVQTGGKTDVKVFWASSKPPKYPMTRKTTVIKCPGPCDFGSREIPTATQPHVTAVYCGPLVGDVVLTYQLTDANGEKSNIVEKTFTCFKPKV